MQLLHNYKNGVNEISLHSDGTKIRTKLGPAEFPDHCDIKITNYCDAGCAYCHEQSTIRGKHGDIDWLLGFIEELPSGFELAIGGGNPLDHPDLTKLLEICRDRGHIPNMTINQLHLESHKDQILAATKLTYGVGLSVRDVESLEKVNYIKDNPHLVYHLILGIHDFSDFIKLRSKNPDCKILLLGYKQWGFGRKYKESERRSSDIDNRIKRWRAHIPHILNISGVTSFDNLAITQLDLENWFSPEEWREMYMGDDGEFSMYIDCLEKACAISSTNPNKIKVENRSIKQCFASLNV